MENTGEVSFEILENDADYGVDLLNQDTTHLEKILADKIWDRVMEKLESSPEALVSLMNSSPYFRKLLSSQRTLFLFEKVVKVMWKNREENGLTFSDALKCRTVCSLWNGVVDKRLNGKWIPSKLPETFFRVPCFKTTNVFDPTSKHVFKFLNHFEATHGKADVVRSPFIWNNLTVITVNSENGLTGECHEYLEAVSDVLRKFGRFVEEFKLEIAGFAFYVEDALKLQEWLAHMPNLKSLDIYDETPSYEWNMSLDEFQAKMTATNFPKFDKMKKLECVNFRQVRAPVFNRFIERNHHIPKLYLSGCSPEYSFFTLPFQNLFLFDMNFDSVETFEKFKRSAQVQWPMVTTLSIYFFPPNPSLFVPLSGIFQVIQAKFTSKLDTLHLQPPKAMTAKQANSLRMDSANCRLVLPNLMGVQLSLRDPICLDFLLEMKHMLESIRLHIDYKMPQKKYKGISQSIVPLKGFEKKIRKSNIPKLFTNLETVGVSVGSIFEIKWYAF